MEVQNTTSVKEIQPNSQKKLKYERDKDRQMVKGVFRFHEVEGGTLKFPIRLHKGDEIANYTLQDGKVYTLPLGVAKHLNRNCWYPVHAHKLNENGDPQEIVGTKVRRTSFQSLEFIDPEDLE